MRAFVIYLRSVQGIALARLVVVLHDLFGLEISEGALVAILDDSRLAFAAQTSAIKARLLSGTALACDETGVRVGKANWWLWVFHHGLDAVFVVDPHRKQAVVKDFLGDWRPQFWLSDRLGSQRGWAKRRNHVFKRLEQCEPAPNAPPYSQNAESADGSTAPATPSQGGEAARPPLPHDLFI